jgi:RNase adapter protein RapZ
VQIVIVTGLSGAGKSTALRALEDVGFYCADNLPLPLVHDLCATLADAGEARVAISVDGRQQPFLAHFADEVARLRAAAHDVEVLYLEAGDPSLLRRYSETRRRHPLAGDDLVDGIRRDKEVLSRLREGAAVLNTEQLNVHQLKGIIQERYGAADGALAVTLLSFGYKRGIPLEADLVFDVRFLANPYFDAKLSGLDGRDREVQQFVLQLEEAKAFMEHLGRLLAFSLPQYEREGKLYLTIAVGCTGGRHRSVAVVEELKASLEPAWNVSVRHRDLERGG